MENTKISLLDKEKTYKINKASALIQVDSTDFSYYWKKIFNGLIYIIKKQLEKTPEKNEFRIDLPVLKRTIWLEKANSQLFKENLIMIQKIGLTFNVCWKDTERWEKIHFIRRLSYVVEWKKGGNSVWFQGERGRTCYYIILLEDQIKEAIRKPDRFATLDMVLMKRLKSKYSIGLYEYLKDYERKKGWKWMIEIEIDKIKIIMGVDSKKYTIFTMFKKRVLEPALKQIREEMDLNIEYKLNKVWRKYKTISFLIIKKEKDQIIIEIKGIDNKLNMKLTNYFMLSKIQVKKVLNRHKDYSVIDNILNKIEKDYKEGKIKTIWPYTYKVLMESGLNTKSLFDVEIEEKKEKKKKEEMLDNRKKEEEKRKQEEKRKEIDSIYINLPVKRKKELLKQYEKTLNWIIKEKYQKYWIDSNLFKGLFLSYLHKDWIM